MINKHSKEGQKMKQTKAIFWVTAIEETEFINEVRWIGQETDETPILNMKPERWFEDEIDALNWIQEHEGEWTIVKVFHTTGGE
jgi:hypothetical protein